MRSSGSIPGLKNRRLEAAGRDVGYANLNTGAFDGDGIHWFTGQNGIYGRLDPGQAKSRSSRTPTDAGPTASPPRRRATSIMCLAGSHLAKVDQEDRAAAIIEPPTPNQGARRVWSDSKGDLWISEWNSGQLSRYSPATKAWKSWKLPGDEPKAYAVYVDERDIVWVTATGANATLSFDPAAEVGVRQCTRRKRPPDPWASGRSLSALQSGTNRVMLIREKAQ